MATKTTGLDSAALLPVGTIIESTYYTAPHGPVDGPKYGTEHEAIEAGLARQAAAVAASKAQRGNAGVSYVPESFVVDLRWKLATPTVAGGGATDVVALRTSYETLDDAHQHLKLIAASR